MKGVEQALGFGASLAGLDVLMFWKAEQGCFLRFHSLQTARGA
jgi:hypothetical protein